MRDQYPFEEYRAGTEQALDEIVTAKEEGKRFILVDGPTGSGKSGIAVAFARSEKSVIVTPTKMLQHQYANTEKFKQEYTIFGKANYQCGLPDMKDLRVDEAICCSPAVTRDNLGFIPWTKEDGFDASKYFKGDPINARLQKTCVAKGVCSYYSKIDKISKVPGAVLNYDLLSFLKRMPNQEGGIEMGTSIVMDEAHALLDKMRSVYGFQLSIDRAVRLFGPDGSRQAGESAVAWLIRLMEYASKNKDQETDPKEASSLNVFHANLQRLLKLGVADKKKFHIQDTGDKIEIKPLDLRLFKDLVFYPFKTVLMLSATFPHNFCEILGLEEDEVSRVTIPSTFVVENRPAVFLGNAPSINWRTTFNDHHFCIKAIRTILDRHPEDKGIIHSANYKLFGQLRTIFKGNKRFVWVDRDLDKDEVIEYHAKSKIPTILVSPSMMEGVDLKDDLARFQVLLKVPYASLDDYTKKMMEIFDGFYENETITKITQAYGRAVRSSDDFATFYILDGAFNRLLKRNRKLFSPYFLEALSVAKANF